jgi:hypothetical protein
MSGGWPSQAKKRVGGAGRSRAERGDYTARVFCPQGLALTAWGPQAPSSNEQIQPQAVIKQERWAYQAERSGDHSLAARSVKWAPAGA